MPRARHQKPELEAVLREAERQNWRVERNRGYYMMMCPCELRHRKTVKLTPSDPNYKRHLVAQLRRATCWEQT